MLNHSKWQLLGFVILAFTLSSCAEQYPRDAMTAQFSSGEKFTGVMKPGFFHQESSIVLTSLDQATHCYGTAHTTSPSGTTDVSILHCEKNSGIMTFQCDDGRHISANWTATSCSSGYGSGYDDAGEKVSFLYGAKVNSHKFNE